MYPTGFTATEGGSPYVIETVAGGDIVHGPCYPGTAELEAPDSSCAAAVDVTCAVMANGGSLTVQTLTSGTLAPSSAYNLQYSLCVPRHGDPEL